MPTVVDILAVIIVILCAIRGFCRGLSGELAQLAGTIAVFVFGVLAYHPLGVWLNEHTRLETRSALTVAFLLTIVLSVILMLLIRYILKKIIKFIVAERADKLGGFIAGFVKGSVLVIIIFFMMNLWPHEYLNRVFGEQSLIGNAVVKYLPELDEMIEKHKNND